jgi:tellurite resistance protein
VASGWLARLHPGLFGIPMGLLGLAGTWARLDRPTPGVRSSVATMSMAIAARGALIWAVQCVLWLARWLRHHEQVHGMWRHPLQGSFLALAPVSTLLVVTYYAPLSASTPWHVPALALLGAALLLQLAIAWQVVSQLTTGRIAAELVTPALYLPPVAGGFVGAMALQALGFHGWAVLWPDLPADVLFVALGIGPVLAVLSRWRCWTEAPFSPGFWSFSFPIAAYAGAVVAAVHRGGWSVAVAWLATLLASAVIGYLALRTLALWRAGRLLPPA